MNGNETIIDCHVRCRGRTGVEIEALTGASVAAPTVYDICKALPHNMLIHEVHLVGTRGGKRVFKEIVPAVTVR